MTNHENEKLVRELYDLLEKNDLNSAFSLLAPNAEFKLAGMESPFRGPKAITEAFKTWTRAFPDMKRQIVNLASSDEWIVIEEINCGTHKGTLEGPGGGLPATHRKIAVPACTWLRIVHGKILTWNLYWQSDVMMIQLGYGPQNMEV